MRRTSQRAGFHDETDEAVDHIVRLHNPALCSDQLYMGVSAVMVALPVRGSLGHSPGRSWISQLRCRRRRRRPAMPIFVPREPGRV